MLESPPYKRFLLSCFLVLLASSFSGELIQKGPPKEYTDDAVIVEGYVASIGFGKISLTDEPLSLWDRVTFTLFTDYSIMVERQADAGKFTLFNGLKLNQQVRVYGDSLLESSPARIKAYHIEKID